MKRELQHRTNNAYDTIVLVEYGIVGAVVIGAWTVGERGDEMDNYNNPGDLADWEPNNPAETDPDAYGTLVV